MKKLLLVKVFLLIFFVSFCFVSLPNPVGAQEKVITLNFANFFPAPHKNSKIIEEWIKEIEQKTNGKVKISYFPGGTLAPPASCQPNPILG